MSALKEAQALLQQLIADAQKGAIIPLRLPRQLEAIAEQLAKAQQESDAVSSAPAAPPPVPETDRAQWLQEQAYFFGHAIHELRTPMTSIRGYSDMLGNPAMGALTEMQKQFVETIRTNSRRMEGLLTDLSDMNKLRAGTLKLTPKMDVFKNIAMMVEKATQPLADAQKVTLTFDIPQGLPILNVDGEMFAKALIKLVENAIRYHAADAADKRVTVSASAADKHLIVTIADNGIGMSEDELKQLGTLYFRSENELVRTFKGSGLGIPIAYGIIRLIGAEVQVKSAPGSGTTFTITLEGMN